MKPYGLSYSVTGCTCALCRSRGYRKSNAYSSVLRADKHRARQALMNPLMIFIKIIKLR